MAAGPTGSRMSDAPSWTSVSTTRARRSRQASSSDGRRLSRATRTQGWAPAMTALRSRRPGPLQAGDPMRPFPRRVLLAALALVVAKCAHAVPAVDSWGVRGGASISSIASGGYEWGRRSAFAGGGFVRYRMEPWLEVEPEALYVQKGATTPVGLSHLLDPTGSEHLLFRYDYIEVPVLFVLTPPAR